MTRRVSGHHAPCLWSDLVRWTAKRGGVASASRALAAGARLRLFGRWCLTPAVAHNTRARWHDERAEIRDALAALRALRR